MLLFLSGRLFAPVECPGICLTQGVIVNAYIIKGSLPLLVSGWVICTNENWLVIDIQRTSGTECFVLFAVNIQDDLSPIIYADQVMPVSVLDQSTSSKGPARNNLDI